MICARAGSPHPQLSSGTYVDEGQSGLRGAPVSEGPPLRKPPPAASIFHNSYFTSKYYYRYNEPQTDQ